MPDFTARDFWQQQVLSQLRRAGVRGPVTQWFRERWDAQPDEEQAARWARDEAAAEFLAQSSP